MRSATLEPRRSADPAVAVTFFICTNCARPGQAPDSGGRPRPTVPRFSWPFPVDEILVPCTGRIQPEHVLKALESGADLVGIVACEEDNCHYLEGSRRCSRRVDYLRAVLEEIGLEEQRLLFFHLPGTAAEDTTLGARSTADPGSLRNTRDVRELEARVAAIRDEMMRVLDGLAPNPLATIVVGTAERHYEELDTSDDAGED